MVARQYYANESLGEVTDSAGTYTDIVTLTFTPDASKDYIIFWSGEFQSNSASEDALGRVYDGTNAYEATEVRAKEISTPVDYSSFGGFFRYQSGGSPSSMTFRLQVRRDSTNTAKGKNGRLVALRLETGDVYAESLAQQTSTSTTPVAAVTTGALSNVAYVMMASCAITNSGSTTRTNVGIRYNASTDTNWDFSADTAGQAWPFLMAVEGTISGGGALSLRFWRSAGAGTAGVTNSKVLALLKSGFDNVYSIVSSSDSGGTNTSYADSNVTQTFTPAATPHLTIAGWNMEGTVTNVTSYTNVLDNGSQVAEAMREPHYITTAARALPMGFIQQATFAASSRTQKIQRKSETSGSTTTVRTGSAIISLDLGSGSGSQGLTPSLFTNAQSFYGPTITTGAVGLTPSLFTNTNSFFAATVSQGAQDLTPTLFTNSQSFFGSTVTVGAVTLTPSLFTNSSTFYAPTVTRGAVSLAPSLFSNSQTFHAATVSASYTLAPALFTNTATFYGPTITTGAVTLAPSLFTNSQTFHAATVTPGSVTLTPALFTNGQTFFGPVVSAGGGLLAPSLFTNSQTFFGPSISVGGVSVAPSLLTNGQVFYAATVSAGAVSLAPPLVTNSQTFYGPTVIGVTILAPALLTNAQTFFAASVAPGAVILTSALLTNTQGFYGPSVSPGGVTLSPPLVASATAFYAPTVAFSSQTLAPSLIANDNEFFSPTATPGPVTLAADLFASETVIYPPAFVGRPPRKSTASRGSTPSAAPVRLNTQENVRHGSQADNTARRGTDHPRRSQAASASRTRSA